MKIIDRIQHAWTVFRNDGKELRDFGSSSGHPAHKVTTSYNSSNFSSTVFNRIAIDVSMAKLKHVKVDAKTEDVKTMETGLNNCLTLEANIDQTHIQFLHDMVYSMFDEGVVAVVPTETTISPEISNGYDIDAMRVGRILRWYPKHVTVRLYNQETGQNEDVTLEKKMVAIIENPLYAVVNGENSILKRLISKINLLDQEDAAGSGGRLDLIIHVPYGIKTNLQKAMAEERIKAVEEQLRVGRHGIAYMDATEKMTQLNRPVNAQLPEEVEKLMKQFYNQLGMTETIFNGTASEEELRLYYSRTIDPILENIIAEFNRKFLTKTGRTQGQEIKYYRDMFKFVTVEMLSTLGDTVRRNSILSSNEMRGILGFRPSDDPRADELFNPNIADKNQNIAPSPEKIGSLTSPDNNKSK